MLITAGPTHEPIDAVRFVGNRSSGRMGIALAEEAARRGWRTTLLLGPVARTPTDSRVRVRRFRTCADLQGLLKEESGSCDVLIMAAAVADYRPKVDPAQFNGKFRRTSGPLQLTLEPTPDLIAEVSARRAPGQVLVGFALEPRDELVDSARGKLTRKKLDMVVGNPLETMDAEDIEGMVVFADGSIRRAPETMSKTAFATWLLEVIEGVARGRA